MKGAGGLLSPAGKRRVCTSMKILFVCTGNTCRSPMAEGIFRKMMVERGMEERVLCQSAGLSAVEGAPVSENAVLACRKSAWIYPTTPPGASRGRSFPCGICTSPCPRPTGTSWPRPGCPRRKSTSPSTSPTPMGPPWRTTGPVGTSWSSSWRCSTRATSPGCWCSTTPCPRRRPSQRAAGPALTYGKKRESCQKRGFGALFFWGAAGRNPPRP